MFMGSNKRLVELIKKQIKKMTPTQKIKDIEKGCGKNYYGIGICPERCGDFGTEKILLCEECQAKLSILKEWEAEDKRKAEELKDQIKSRISETPNDNDCCRIELDMVEDEVDEIFSPQEDGK